MNTAAAQLLEHVEQKPPDLCEPHRCRPASSAMRIGDEIIMTLAKAVPDRQHFAGKRGAVDMASTKEIKSTHEERIADTQKDHQRHVSHRLHQAPQGQSRAGRTRAPYFEALRGEIKRIFRTAGGRGQRPTSTPRTRRASRREPTAAWSSPRIRVWPALTTMNVHEEGRRAAGQASATPSSSWWASMDGTIFEPAPHSR